jgi:glycine hydroxymethyltransferase
MAHFSGLVAGKAFTGEFDPVPYAHVVTSTTHKTLRGPRGGFILAKKEFEEVINKGCPLVLGGPLPHVIAAKAVAFKEADTEEFQHYAKQVVENAATLAESLKEKGLHLVTGGTENHLVIIDLTSLNITGRHAETALRQAGITVNRNAIPFDHNGPWYTSGVRLGTPAMTTLGMKGLEMREIADVIAEVLKNTTPTTIEKTGKPSLARCLVDPSILKKARGRVGDLLARYPLYPEIELGSEAATPIINQH